MAFNKSNKKIVTTALTAAMVASAVAPVAAAKVTPQQDATNKVNAYLKVTLKTSADAKKADLIKKAALDAVKKLTSKNDAKLKTSLTGKINAKSASLSKDLAKIVAAEKAKTDAAEKVKVAAAANAVNAFTALPTVKTEAEWTNSLKLKDAALKAISVLADAKLKASYTSTVNAKNTDQGNAINQVRAVVAATKAVADFENFPIKASTDADQAKTLKDAATTAVAKVADKATADALTARISAQDTKNQAALATFNAPVVTGVSAINTTSVKVTFNALEKGMTNVVFQVVDNNGKTVEVNPVDLQVGETVATVTFKTTLASNPVGIWTVGSFKFDNDAVKNFNDIVTAASSNNEVTTLAALKKANINNLKDSNITVYVTAINASTTKEKLADIQAIIDKTNTSAVSSDDAAAAVKAVNDATNQVQLLAALQGKAFARVNPDWIVNYYSTIITTAKANAASNIDSVAKIQTYIDQVDSSAIITANGAATSVATQNAVTTLIQAYTPDDVAPATTKAAAIKASTIKSAVFGVKEATTAATVYNALVNLSSLDSTTLPASALNVNLKSDYLTAKSAANFTDTTSVKNTIVTAADTASSTAALTTINGITSTTDLAVVKADLQKLADVTSHKGAAKFDMSKVVDARLSDYRSAIIAAEGASITQVAVTNAIAGVNAAANQAVNLATLKDTTKTVIQVRDALVELAAGVTANATTNAYLNASTQFKLEVAQFVVNNRSSLDPNLTAAIVTDNAGTGYTTSPLKQAIADQSAQLAKFNAIGDLASVATTISTTKANLDTYAYAPYVALTVSQQLAVAEEINKLTKPAGNPAVATPLNFSTGDAVATLAQANAYIDAAIKKVLGN